MLVNPSALACGGAAGVKKPGFQQFVQVAASAVEAFIIELGEGSVPAVLIGSIASAETYNLLDICGRPDPGDPVLTVQDFLAAANQSDPLNSIPAIQRIEQWFVHMMWPNWCDCANGTAPPPSTSAPLPPGTQNPGLPSAPANAPCWNQTSSFQTSGPNGTPPTDISTLILPNNVSRTVPPGGTTWPTTAWQIPNGITSIVNVQTLHDAPQGVACLSQMVIYDNSGNILSTPILGDYNVAATGTVNITLPTGAAWWLAWASSGDNTIHNWTNNLSFDCPGQPGNQLQAPCCPPDPLLEARLNAIYQLEQAIYNLLGRAAGYTKGNQHLAVSGSGSLSVTGVTGFEVDITAAPPTKTQPGTPPYIWDMGWLSILTGDGMIDEKRLTRTHQLWLPQLAPLATTFGYYFNPGVVANVTELRPL